ncbi:LuxR family two component transcriptional regulator [Saccharopolyspora erythraea NRRL 2338]|uniref:Two-component system response regulator n=2 Tax=Saccharopolyspora erythraea TaxID=1836 RepID=A4F7V4_SACEN|nr:response regulator transcription factor [Saccharopolyspora erythraea]EQD85153.1 MerR family transcriptional regulator [Saccharopolyspora erythraea D]PFG93927.1 LuxR family two component transcriptional regulator [Saccharopolyspora erythraea NRRL 2338]QRK90750.1 response regulator transcription factor [Saccharopolyspora erythraea]CAM00128.1 putative two-component system response regulator [Saccharopolyspora erythraea NRRL 2338]
MIRVVLADDEDLIRGALAALLDLEPDISVLAQVGDGRAAVRAVTEHRPDVAVFDLEMPELDGVQAATEVRRVAELPIVLVTRHARPGVLRRALAAGVRGFVPKTTPATRLAAILRDVHGGGRYVDPEIAASALTEGACPLTARELELLRHTVRGGTIAAIADEVHLAQGTVRNYLSAAMAKLSVSTRHEAARRAWEEGWI